MKGERILTLSKAAAAALAMIWGGPCIARSVAGDYTPYEPEARILLERALAADPAAQERDGLILRLADWHFYNGQYPDALRLYNELRDDAFSGDVKEGMLYRKAYTLIKTGYYDEAAALLHRLAGSRTYGADAAFYLAYTDYVGGRYDAAYEQFGRLKGSATKGHEADYYINQIDYLRGNYKKTAAGSERLLGGNVPAELRAETMRVGGLSHFKLGDKTKARKLLEPYVELTGDGAEIGTLYALATIYYDEGDYARALPLLTTVTEYPGDMAQSAWLYIGQINMQQGDPQAAALAFDKAAKESWNGDVAETAAYNLAVSSTAGGALPFADAAAAMESFVETYPDSPYAPSLSAYLANAYYGKRDYENALRQTDRIARPDAATKAMRQKILYQLGVTRLQQGRLADAIRYLGEAAGGPDAEVGAQASLWLGDAYYARKDYRNAAKAYEAAIAGNRLGENSQLAQYNIGYAYMKLGDYRKAETAFRKATAVRGLDRSQTADARLRYADCLYYNGKYPEALAIFRDMKIEGGEDGAFAIIREADILGRNGQVDDKIRLLEGVVDRADAGRWRQTAMERLADAYSEKGDDRKAAELYSRMLDTPELHTDRMQMYYSLAANAEKLYESGDTDAAYEAYRRLENSGIPELYPLAAEGLMLTRAKATVADAERMIKAGKAAEAETMLLEFIDGGVDDNYWMARAYIALADAYAAQGKDYLARLYMENLQANYPDDDPEIRRMIDSRLKKLSE